MPKSTSRKKKHPKRVLALPDLEHAKTAVLNSLTSASGQRTYDHAIREFVAWLLFGAAARVQSYRGAPISHSPGTTRIRAGNDQSAVGGGSPHRLRGRRRRSPEPGAGRRHSQGEGGAADRRTPRKLADA